jgi:hypothetical protein
VTVWGIAARIEGGNPVVVALELDGSRAAPSGRQVLLHRCEATDMARALMLLANDMEHELGKNPPAVVVVRAMDWFHARREKVARPRLQVEGVLLAVSRRLVPTVVSMSGKEIGDLSGLSKAQIEAEASRVLGGLDLNAAVAGLGALTLAETSP